MYTIIVFISLWIQLLTKEIDKIYDQRKIDFSFCTAFPDCKVVCHIVRHFCSIVFPKLK
jgi:hypothetical protein